jgi:thiamine-monophosphate kinase
LISSDILIEGEHFNEWFSPFDIGYRAIVQNVSDIFAMGGEAKNVVISLGMRKQDANDKFVRKIAEGIKSASEKYGVQVRGGDISKSCKTVISVCVTGNLITKHPILRSGAKAGDSLCHIGNRGTAFAGFDLLKNEIQGFEEIKDLFKRPAPPILNFNENTTVLSQNTSVPLFESQNIFSHATSMLDISDGLMIDAHKIASASKVLLEIDYHLFENAKNILLPAAKALSKICSPDELVAKWILKGGEDHGFLFTLPKEINSPYKIGTVIEGKSEKAVNIININADSSKFVDYGHFNND